MLQQLRERGLALLSSTLRDRPQHQQSLRDAIAWSYDLLDPTQQALFRRLAVFVGGCTVDAAEAICATDPAYLLDGLEALLSQSLLRQSDAFGEGRLTMLEPFRDFALEQLSAAGELGPIQQRHALYFAELAERREPEISGPRQAKRCSASSASTTTAGRLCVGP